jgi:hypothetical protein
MRIIAEEIEASVYQDLILSEEEAQLLLSGRLLEGMTIVKGRRFYIGLRVGDKWRYEDQATSGFLNEEDAE